MLIVQTVRVMGLLLDLECPATMRCELRPARARKQRRRIETDTPIAPRAVAVAVWEEASVWLEAELPRAWIGMLAERADVIYAHNRRFRQLIRGGGCTGRDWLWSFTRHWLSALIARHRPQLHRRLPASYSVGRTLPPKIESLE